MKLSFEYSDATKCVTESEIPRSASRVTETTEITTDQIPNPLIPTLFTIILKPKNVIMDKKTISKTLIIAFLLRDLKFIDKV